MDQLDYYKILQVDPAAELEVITAAYKRLAQKYHPDGHQLTIESRRMQDINLAYAVLRDSDKRAQYDRMRVAQPATAERFQTVAAPVVFQAAAATPQLPPQQALRILSAWRVILVCLGIAALLAVGTTLVLRQPAAEPPSASTIWDGECRNPTGYVYSCRVRIKISAANRVTGSIQWSLKASPRADEQLAIGRKAKASVKGTFDPSSRRIAIGSYSEDDPYRMIEVNEYTLSLSADGRTLSGETYNDGVWLGTLSATLKE
jgi:hypothetical protein